MSVMSAPEAVTPSTGAAALPSLEAVDAVKHFQGVRAINGVSLRLAQGEIVGLIGPNGSGKTTLLNLLSGAYALTSGDVYCGGRRVTGMKPYQIARRGVGRTFQNIRLFGHLSVDENIETGSISGRKVKGVDHRAQVEALMERFALAPVRTQPTLSLPYGVQRRVEIARAVAGRPLFLLLDEPAAGMNEAESDELLAVIRGVRDDYECGVLIVDHDLRLIMRLCERIHVLAEGTTLTEGRPDEVRSSRDVIEVFLGGAAEALM